MKRRSTNEDSETLTALVAGVDIGGTFTDLILIAKDGTKHLLKLPSTPPNFGDAVVRGLRSVLDRNGGEEETVASVIHGTTVATNAILERRGAVTALLTTRGFRDVLEIGRLRYPVPYDLFWDKPPALIPRRLRFQVDERINSKGGVEASLDRKQIEQLYETLIDHNVQSVAVCLINSYLNATHEQLIEEVLDERNSDLSVSVSCEILPEIKEFERTSTTAVNAYVRPLVDQYIADLEDKLRNLGVSSPLLIMQSSGGLLSSSIARTRPVQMVESGPAAGVIAAQKMAARLGMENLIAFDMGGTTAKASLIEGGEPFVAPEYEVGDAMNTHRSLAKGGGYPIRVPSIDISEVGAGGGSIVWIDAGGAPRVGPQSSGAVPGPACYGHGGTFPTLTDAIVVLGYFNPLILAGGAQRVDHQRAIEVIGEQVAKPLGLGLMEAAYGVYAIAISNMNQALKAVTSERGRDPRDFALLAFGGAGPAHAVEMAKDFQIRTVIIPTNSGLFSTAGLLVADVQHDDVCSYTKRDEFDRDEIEALFRRMEERTLSQMEQEGFERDGVTIRRYADLRYLGQSFELRVPMSSRSVTDADVRVLCEAFAADHQRTYGHGGLDRPMEIVNLRLRAIHAGLESERMGVFSASESTSSQGPGKKEEDRNAYFGPEIGMLTTPVVSRLQLGREPISGPLIVEDMDATTVVPPGSIARLDTLGNIVIDVGDVP